VKDPSHQYRSLPNDARERDHHLGTIRLLSGNPGPREGIRMSTNKDEYSSGSGPAGPRRPTAEGKESFDEAVTEHLAEGKGDPEEARSRDEGDEGDQPALKEQSTEGNPAKTDNE
jgi:hypothetical protein